MGLILCETHGQQGITFVCPHLEEKILSSQPIKFEKRADVEFEEICWYLCESCNAHFLNDSFFDSQDKSLQIICGKCFIEYKETF